MKEFQLLQSITSLGYSRGLLKREGCSPSRDLKIGKTPCLTTTTFKCLFLRKFKDFLVSAFANKVNQCHLSDDLDEDWKKRKKYVCRDWRITARHEDDDDTLICKNKRRYNGFWSSNHNTYIFSVHTLMDVSISICRRKSVG